MGKHIPDIYIPMYPGSDIRGPLRWQDDTTGVLPAAVHSFYQVQGAEPLTPEKLELVREYAEYYINAPCWDDASYEPETWQRLRADIKHITTFQAMLHWLEQALEVTIDPF
jgi:hypothetical protein